MLYEGVVNVIVQYCATLWKYKINKYVRFSRLYAFETRSGVYMSVQKVFFRMWQIKNKNNMDITGMNSIGLLSLQFV